MLPRIVGLGRANDLLLTSRVFWSDEAERIGFVNQLHDAEVLVSAAQAYATDPLNRYLQSRYAKLVGRCIRTCMAVLQNRWTTPSNCLKP